MSKCGRNPAARPHRRARRSLREARTPPSMPAELDARWHEGKRHCTSGTNHRHEPQAEGISAASSSRPKGKRKRAANRAPNSASKPCGGMARTTYACRRGPAQRMAGPQISIPRTVTSTICAASQDPDHPRKTLDANLPEGATPGGVLAHSRASARTAGMHGAAANILAIAARCVRTTVLHGHRPNQTSRATAQTPKEECSA